MPARSVLAALGPLPIYAGVECATHNSPFSPIDGEEAYWCLRGAHAVPWRSDA